MARHIMAVCVVCLLCADHLPCKQHDDEPLGPRTLNAIVAGHHNDFRRIEDGSSLEKSQPVKRHTHDHHHHGHGHGHDHEDDDDDDGGNGEAERREKLDGFMQRIFSEFGDPGTMTMDVAGFEAMVKRLNMYRLVTEERTPSRVPSSTTGTGGGIGHEHEDDGSCINSVDLVRHVAVPNPEAAASLVPAGNLSQSSSPSSAANSSIVSPSDKLSNKSSSSANGTTTPNGTSSVPSELDRLKASIRLDRNDLYNICPILLAQLASKTSRERAGCIDPASVPDLRTLDSSLGLPQGEHVHGADAIEPSVWIYSTLAILGVSLCGLLGVAVIPCMDKHFYQHVLQFLVALAVGTLCGDALLHLLPHAMMGSGSSNPHDDMMYKGLAAVCGIVFFYFMERFLTVVAEWYKNQEKKDKPSSRVRVMRDPESTTGHPVASGGGEKQCKHKYSSYPYCYDEIAMDTKDDHHEHNHVENHHNNHNNALAKCANHGEHGDHHSEYASLQGNGKPASIEDAANQQDNNTVSTNLDDASIESEQQKPPSKSTRPAENYTIILREHETKHHGHSHTHGHVHSPPGSLSAVAWMVIMGDGLHNFTDGMTIGAAFANNIAGGFSTAIAVFCHELPHELGDFAVLLKAGMSARDAVYYNLLSSILSFIGMLIGIVIGHQEEASSWVFAVAAGLFLYIALVDMIPELTSAHGAEDRCKTSEFLLQFFGMSAGFGIMLLIAMYEHDLKQMFVD